MLFLELPPRCLFRALMSCWRLFWFSWVAMYSVRSRRCGEVVQHGGRVLQ